MYTLIQWMAIVCQSGADSMFHDHERNVTTKGQVLQDKSMQGYQV